MDLTDRRFLPREPGLPSSVALLAVGLVPSLLWAAVGIPLVSWNFADASRREVISSFSVGMLVGVAVANLAPFVVSGLVLVRARRRGRLSWPNALRAAAPWVGIASGISFVATLAGTGGMP